MTGLCGDYCTCPCAARMGEVGWLFLLGAVGEGGDEAAEEKDGEE